VPIWSAGCVFEAGSNVVAVEVLSGPLEHYGDAACAAAEALVAERFLLLEGVDADELSDLFDDVPCVGDIEAVPGVGELA
jgi:hypothetical protein